MKRAKLTAPAPSAEGTGALVASRFSSAYGALPVDAAVEALRVKVSAIQRGDLREAEAILTSQAVALDAIFGNLATRASVYMVEGDGRLFDRGERYFRLALKAQSQCRATLETLAVLKNPPTVFARQANIANGPQQVNNGGLPPITNATRAETTEARTRRNELLEAQHGQRLDERATGSSGKEHSAVAPVGTIDRASDA